MPIKDFDENFRSLSKENRFCFLRGNLIHMLKKINLFSQIPSISLMKDLKMN